MGGGKSKAAATPIQPILPEAGDDGDAGNDRAAAEADAEEQRRRQQAQQAQQAKARREGTDEATSVAKDLEDEGDSEEEELVLNFSTIKELWFTAASGGRGRALVELKDMCQSSKRVFHGLFSQYCGDPGAGMVLSEFQTFVRASGTDLDEDASKAQFFEAAGYPDDEDDASQVAKIRATPGVFATAVVRVANAYVMQEFGESEKTLCEQLSDWFAACKDKLGCQADLSSSESVRDPSFFSPPPDFVGTHPRVFLQLAGGSKDGGGGGRVVIELNGAAAPKAAYNFQALCTGERGSGELTGLPLTLKGCAFHRLVAGMCLQGGDIEGNDGYGGESVYGGEFEDSAFTLKHEEAGVVSCGNAGPNTNTSQFFFTLAAAPHLDGENVAFGKVVEGLDVVMALGSCTVDDDEVPTPPIVVADCGMA